MTRRTRNSTWQIVLPAVLVAALLAGCGSGDGDGEEPVAGDPGGGAPATATPPGEDPGTGSGPDPCTLLTEDDVSGVAGAEVTGVSGPTTANQGANCTWSFPGAVLGEVTVSVWAGLEFYSPDTVPDAFEEVPGIGDAAHRAGGGGALLCTIIFRVGEVVVQVISSDAGEDGCLELARTAAGRV